MVIRVYVVREGGVESGNFARSMERAEYLMNEWRKVGYRPHMQIIRE